MTTLYILAIIALLIGTAAIYMAMIKPFPVPRSMALLPLLHPKADCLDDFRRLSALGDVADSQYRLFPVNGLCSIGTDGVGCRADVPNAPGNRFSSS